MASSEHHDPNELLDAYLDGRLDAGARAQFERRMQEDEGLRAMVQLQTQIDEGIRRTHPVPDVEQLIGRLNGQLKPGRVAASAAASSIPFFKRWAPGLSMAAAVALAVGAFWYFTREGSVEEPVNWVTQRRTITEAYDEMVRTGFKPLWLCKNDHQFAATFKKRFDQGLILAKAPDVNCLGIHYVNSITPKTTVLLVDVKGSKSMVFVDALTKDSPIELKGYKGLNLFRKEIGKTVLYELTPESAPHTLDLISEIEVPPEWLNEYADGSVPGAPPKQP